MVKGFINLIKGGLFSRNANKKMKNLKLNNRCLFFPDDTISKIWNSLISVVLIYVTFALTFELAFIKSSNAFFQMSEYITSILFFFDLIFNFNKVYQDQSGKLIVNRKKIIWNYLKCWFIIDFISCFPFYLFTKTGKESIVQSIKTTKILRYFKIIRILRLLKFVKKFFPQYLKNRSKRNFVKFKSNEERLILHLFIASIIAHCSACIFYAIPMYFSPEKNWVKLRNLQNHSNFDLYLYSLHWVIETMITVGYGENTFRFEKIIFY